MLIREQVVDCCLYLFCKGCFWALCWYASWDIIHAGTLIVFCFIFAVPHLVNWWLLSLLFFHSAGCDLGHPGPGIWLLFLLIFLHNFVLLAMLGMGDTFSIVHTGKLIQVDCHFYFSLTQVHCCFCFLLQAIWWPSHSLTAVFLLLLLFMFSQAIFQSRTSMVVDRRIFSCFSS